MSDEDLPQLVAETSKCNIDSDNSDDDDQWIEENESQETRCLFSDKTFNNIEDAIKHLKEKYDFDLSELKRKHQMDFYNYIKLINFIRHEKIASPKNLFTEDNNPLWLDDKYLKPANEEFETWLSYDFDNLDNLDITASTSDDAKLIQELRAELAMKDQLLQQAFDDKEKMKEAFKRLMNDSKTLNGSDDVEVAVGNKLLENDSAYFESYSHFDIHHAMLSDKARTDSYRDAIMKNPDTFKDKIVLDVGCGTSILSMFAAEAGAKKILAIDQSDVIYKAMDIARYNGFEDKIEFVKGRLEDVKLPVEKVDIIISEWMGYFLLFEGMLDSVIYARNNYLKEGGHLLPNKCSISIAGYGDEKRYKEFVGFFKSVYGYDMSCMVQDVLSEGHTEFCDSDFQLTKPNEILSLDLMTCDLNYSKFVYDFNLEVTKAGKLSSIVGYFDCVFDLPQKSVTLTTAPGETPTHWKQTVFYFEQPFDVKVGEVVSGKLSCRRDPKDSRSLIVEIIVRGKCYKYKIE